MKKNTKGQIEKYLMQKKNYPPISGIIEWTKEKGTNTKKKSNIEKKKIAVFERNKEGTNRNGKKKPNNQVKKKIH